MNDDKEKTAENAETATQDFLCVLGDLRGFFLNGEA
jgi:hypothetical protein